MQGNKNPRKRKKRHPIKEIRKALSGRSMDYNLLVVVIILVCFGLVMLYSASAYEAAGTYEGDDMKFLRKQAIISAFGLLLALGISFFDYHIYMKLSPVLYIVAIAAMAAVKYTPLGGDETVNGVRRWLYFGSISVQPSEAAKITVILLLAYLMQRMGRDFTSLRGIVILGGVALLAAGSAYFFTDNLSTAIIIAGICIGIIFVAHPRTAAFIIILIIGIIGIAALVYYLTSTMETSESFRIRRILVWMDPEKYSDLGGWQVLQGLYAIGSGGFFGKGLGNSTQKLDIIPEAQNDMIFSIICEELGLFGAVIVLVLFGYLLYRLYVLARTAPDRSGSLIASGIFFHIALQVILNICVVLNVIPTTGITLPFVSYGGTSVVFLMVEMGVALSISARVRPTRIVKLSAAESRSPS